MPRKKQTLIPHAPYFISARCINREWFRIPLPEVWSIMSDYLFFIHHAYDVRIFGFVMMSNHIHILASAPDLAAAMNYFMRETSRVISRNSRRINQVYGGPYHKSLLPTEFAFRSAYKYLFRNPVDANMSAAVEHYPFSTLRALLGLAHSIIPLTEDIIFFDSPDACLSWLNTPYESDQRESLRLAIRRGEFALPKRPNGHANMLAHRGI
jgi:putative transposase